jgi:hypothetical protein
VTSANQTNLAAREIATTLCDEPDRKLPPVSHVKHFRREVERTPLGREQNAQKRRKCGLAE